MRWRAFVVIGLLGAIGAAGPAGCDAMPLAPARASFDNAPPLDPLDADFAPGFAILRGFDAPRDGAGGDTDHQVLLGLKLQDGDAQRIWFVRLRTEARPGDGLEAGAPAPARSASGRTHAHNAITIGKARLEYLSPLRTVQVEVFDGEGRLVAASSGTVPAAFLQHGFVRTCEAYQGLDAGAREALKLSKVEHADELPEYVQAEMGSWLALISLTQTIGSMASMQAMTESIRQVIVRSPGLAVLPALLTGDLHVGLDADFEAASAVPAPWSGATAVAPLFQLPLTASIGGVRVVDARLVVGPADPPYLLSAGILCLEAVHPTRPDHRLTARVIAARLGG